MLIKKECKRNYKLFYDFLKNKRVIIVGPSANLMNFKKGNLINSYDIIVRLNNSFPLYGSLKPHMGNKTDILYYVSGGIDKHFRYIRESRDINVIEHDRIQFIIFKKGHNANSEKYRKRFNRFYRKYSSIIRIFSMKLVTNQLKRELKSDPNMGIIAMVHLLQTELKELRVIGCDFYKFPHYPKYSILPDMIFDKEKRNLKNIRTGWKQKTHHNTSRQLEYLKILMLKEKRLKLDNDLKDMILDNAFKVNKPSGNENILIPKIIHIVWIGSQIPNEYLYNIKTFKKLNPDWEIRIWRDKQIKIEKFINQDLINKMPTYAAKVDIIRLEILYKYGGIYTDCDSTCLKPIDRLIKNKICFGMHDRNGFIANGTLGTTKKHPAFKELVFGFKQHIKNLNGRINTLLVTGTKYITPILKKYNDFTIIDENCSKGKRQYICSVYENNLKECYIYHDLAKSWHDNKYIDL